jgi:hypothetical protein
MFAVSFEAELFYEAVVLTPAHGGIEIDYMEPAVVPKAIKQTEDIGHCKLAFTTVCKLNRSAALQINAGNQHGSLTATPLDRRNSFNARIDCTWS